MANQDTLQEYSDSVRRLRNQCFEAGMNEVEFQRIYFESLQSLENKPTKLKHSERNWRRRGILFAGIILVLFVTYNYKTVYSCIVCNLQDYVYPGLRLLRRISIPFISLFPSLTDFYHESCLIQNPFFSVVDMDCWPCSTVNNVHEVHDPRPVIQQHNAPFIYETSQNIITYENLDFFYNKHKEVFKKESPKVLVNNKFYIDPQEIFQNNVEDNNLYIWRLNTMNIARLLRHIIPRPKVVPKFGQSTERYLIIDSSKESFSLPDTECNFSFLLILSGTRIVNLVPAEECKFQCKSMKVELKETYLLWYNWWYWRPVIQPSTSSNSTLIAHVGSYC